MTWHREKSGRKHASRPLADYDAVPARPVEMTEPAQDESLLPEAVTYPVAVDPETGHVETIGNGRIAVIGAAGVERLVSLPEDDNLIDVAVAARELTYGA